MIKLESFTSKNFEALISWINSRELLLTIAGNYFSFPLNENQLHNYLNDVNSYAFNIINAGDNKLIGHAELYNTGGNVYKIDKLIIGDAASRGKGFCQPVMKALVNYGFTILQAATIELNVFDWNSAAIRCYKKTGFWVNPNKTAKFTINDNTWTALNMIIEK